MQTTLKQDLLTAYGTCDFLSGLLGWDMRRRMESALCRDLYAKTGKRSDVSALCDLFLDLPEHEKERIIERVCTSPARAGGYSIEDLKEDFRWADAYFQTSAPDFPSLNEILLHSILTKIEDRFCNTPHPDASKKTHEIADDLSKDQGAQTESANILLPHSDSSELESDSALDDEKENQLEKDMERLDSLIGLEGVKAEIRDLSALLQISRLRKARGLKTAPAARHLVFSGNPGTGKTTTARILAAIYKDLGFLSKGQLVECSRSDLVGEYIGSSAKKTMEMIKKARGGILFIDEAYSLSRKSEKDFGHEVIEVLLQQMENSRDDLVVIAAGYPDRMEEFLDSNPGLRSRFTTFIHFEDYSARQLMMILRKMAAELDYQLDEEASQVMEQRFEEIAKNRPAHFANGRDVRTLLEKAITRQARRLIEQQKSTALDDEELSILRASDFEPSPSAAL